MKEIRYKVNLDLHPSDFELLLNAITYYGLSSAFLNYGDEIEGCKDMRYKIFKNLECYIKEE